MRRWKPSISPRLRIKKTTVMPIMRRSLIAQNLLVICDLQYTGGLVKIGSKTGKRRKESVRIAG
jgi:hypothetical protein